MLTRTEQEYVAAKEVGTTLANRRSENAAFDELMKHTSTTMSELSAIDFDDRLHRLANALDLGVVKVGRKWDVNDAIGYKGGGAGYGLFVRKDEAIDTIRKVVQIEQLLRSLRKLAGLPEQSATMYAQPWLENDPRYKAK